MTARRNAIIAELQRANAELRRERDEDRAWRAAALAREASLTEALAQRNTAFAERIDHQAATIDVLKAMSASPGDAQPVFDLIAERARDICGGYGVTVTEFDGTLLHWRAATGVSEDPAVREAPKARYPMPPARNLAMGRAILDRGISHIRDTDTEPELGRSAVWDTVKSTVAVPMMRGGVPIGALGMGSREKGGFSETQVELLNTFAEQAVIAITSAETFRALRTRTADLQESLEYQTATSDVLKVISRSTFDVRPILETIAETAARLCGAEQVAIYRFVDGMFRFAAHLGFPPEYAAATAALGAFPLEPNTPSVGHQCVAERAPVHILDVAAVPGYPDVAVRQGKMRTALGVPLLRDGEPIGNIVLARQHVEPFTQRQIDLVSTFADQAVIAIENTRLLTETREALEQQTATAEVLQVINASPGDLTPVFDAILEKAHQLCDAVIGELAVFDGQSLRAVATHGYPGDCAAMLRQPRLPGAISQRIIDGGRLIHVTDLQAGLPGLVGPHADLIRSMDLQTSLMIPLRKDGVFLGYISAFRTHPRAFAEKEIALLENFAAQAVIAMENARTHG